MGWGEICTKEEFREKIYPVCHTVALRLRSRPKKNKTTHRAPPTKCVCLALYSKAKISFPQSSEQNPSSKSLTNPLTPLQHLSQPLAPLPTLSKPKNPPHRTKQYPPFPLPPPLPLPPSPSPFPRPLHQPENAGYIYLNSWARLSLM